MVFRILDRTLWLEFLTTVRITDQPRWSRIPNGRQLLGFPNDRRWSEIPDSQLLTMDSCWELLMIVKNSERMAVVENFRQTSVVGNFLRISHKCFPKINLSEIWEESLVFFYSMLMFPGSSLRFHSLIYQPSYTLMF